MKLLRLVAVLLLFGCALNTTAQEGCHSFEFTHTIEAGDNFSQNIGGGLSLRLNPGDDGWTIDIIPTRQESSGKQDDYIYPVNPPIRFNNLQYLGAAYGDSTRYLVTHEKHLRFVLNQSDYDLISRFITDALWPYNAKDPDRAGEIYLEDLGKLTLGSVHYKPLEYKFNPDGSIDTLKFQMTVIAPKSFSFPDGVKSTPLSCSPR
jgi:hypothetical protein